MRTTSVSVTVIFLKMSFLIFLITAMFKVPPQQLLGTLTKEFCFISSKLSYVSFMLLYSFSCYYILSTRNSLKKNSCG